MATFIFNASDIETCQPQISAPSFQYAEASPRPYQQLPRWQYRPGSLGFYRGLHRIITQRPVRRGTASAITPATIYRRQLRLYRRMAAVIDRHPRIVTAALWLQAIAFMAVVLFS